MIGLNLGCGTDIFKSTKDIEWINIDCEYIDGVDVVWDLNNIPLPVLEESIDIIVMNDILEHLDNPPEIIKECYRLLKNGGKLIIRILYWNHIYNYSDPQHKHVFGPRYFEFFTKDSHRLYYFDFHFDSLKIKYTFDVNAMKKYGPFNRKRLMEKAYYHCNVIDGMHITLVK